MTSDTLALLESHLSRAHGAHVSALLNAMNEAVTVIHPERRATVPESLERFKEKTLWALREYLSEVRKTTLSVIEGTDVSFTSDAKALVIAVVEKFVEPSLYLTRFESYESAVGRHLSRFGGPFDLSDFRPDLTKGTLQVASTNTIRTFLASLADDLEVIVQRQRNKVALTPAPESGLEQANRLIKLEPNFFGIGVNLNYFIRRLLGKRE